MGRHCAHFRATYFHSLLKYNYVGRGAAFICKASTKMQFDKKIWWNVLFESSFQCDPQALNWLVKGHSLTLNTIFWRISVNCPVAIHDTKTAESHVTQKVCKTFEWMLQRRQSKCIKRVKILLDIYRKKKQFFAFNSVIFTHFLHTNWPLFFWNINMC